MKNSLYYYYVEGEMDKLLLETLKQSHDLIKPGKVEVFNVLQKKFSAAKLSMHKPSTTVILIFDTDVEDGANFSACLDCLSENIKTLKKNRHITKIICIPQVKNLEDELSFSCNTKLFDLLNLRHKSSKDFKSSFLKCSNLSHKLQEAEFNIDKLWAKEFPITWKIDAVELKNQANEIRSTNRKNF